VTLEDLGQHISRALPVTPDVTRGELTITCEPDQILPLLHFLRDDAECAFSILIDICGVDWPQRAKRFDVVYHLLSITRNQRVRIKTQLDENQPIASAVGA
jgi:NADH-quinone oxidoreductase subunit C